MAVDSDAWREWFDKHAPALVLFARQSVPSRADAEDVVQEGFARFWQSRERALDATAYLFACVKRSALDWQRSRVRQTKREQAAARPEAEPMFAGPVEQEERRAAIAAALHNLPDPQREVIVMKIWGGLTFPQIAEALAISPNTAASRCRYALARLREQLAEESIR